MNFNRPCLVPNGRGFWELYEQSCFKLGVPCSTLVRKSIDNEVSLELDLGAIREEQWPPIIDALSKCDSLKELGFVNRTFKGRGNGYDSLAIRAEKYNEQWKQTICQKVMKAISIHLWNSISITHLYLKNLSDLVPHVNFFKSNKFVRALSRNDSLRNLWIEDCQLSEADISAICKALKTSMLTHLSFVKCGLSQKSMSSLVALIKAQHDNRRNGIEATDIVTLERTMPGLRRLNVSHNPDIGDKGFEKLLKALENDSWIRALDAHKCSLSDKIWSSVNRLMDANDRILLVDLRFNGLNDRILIDLLSNLQARQNYMRCKYEWQPNLQYTDARHQFYPALMPTFDDERSSRKRRRRTDEDLQVFRDFELRYQKLQNELASCQHQLRTEAFLHEKTRGTLQDVITDLRSMTMSKQAIKHHEIEDIVDAAVTRCKWLRLFENQLVLERHASTSEEATAESDSKVIKNLLSVIEPRPQ